MHPGCRFTDAGHHWPAGSTSITKGAHWTPFRAPLHVSSSPSSSPLKGSDSHDFSLTISAYTLFQLTQSFFLNNILLTVFQITNFWFVGKIKLRLIPLKWGWLIAKQANKLLEFGQGNVLNEDVAGANNAGTKSLLHGVRKFWDSLHLPTLWCWTNYLFSGPQFLHLRIWIRAVSNLGEGDGTPLQYSCLENPMAGGAWWAAVHGVAKSRTQLSIFTFTFTFHFHTLEKEMATHSSVLAWRIPGMGEPGRLPSMGSHRVGRDWSNLAAAAAAVSNL